MVKFHNKFCAYLCAIARMKVLFLIQGFEVAASRYRVLQYLPYLESKGIESTVSLYPRGIGQLFRFFRELPRYDVLFLQRKRFQPGLLGLLRRKARRIVFDFDDAIMYHNSKAASPHSRTRRRRFAEMVKASDYVIAGNSFLEKQAEPFTDRVAVIPSPIDTTRYALKDYSTRKDTVSVGWIGDHGSIHYLERIRQVFEELGRKYPQVQLEIICDIFFDCDHIKVVKKIWSQESEIDDLRNLDIGVMPLLDDPWSWGKCGLKILQYYGVGVPAVCTPVGVNRDVVQDSINGFWAMTHEEWVAKLSTLIEDAELRKAMGIRGNELVTKSFSLQACAPRLEQVLREVVS
jgi:glycosyltransferase involved in cell wall biosynthesis